MQHRFPEACIRAYAGDLAMVTTDGTNRFYELEDIFTEYGRITGLVLNIP